MKLFFLQSTVQLTKQYILKKGVLEKAPYPNAYEVTSIEEQVLSPKDFATALTKHAKLAHCLVKGNLHRTLTKESRAGSTASADSTSWLCLDIDGLPDTHQGNPVTPDVILDAIGLKNVSYVLQWSASYGIENNDIRCHLFVMLDKPYPAQVLKEWLKEKNLTVPLLTDSLSLTTTGNSLHWPLDVSACQNDKLIYIAPPMLKGIADPMVGKPRIVYEKRTKATLSINVAQISSAAKNSAATVTQIDRLRVAAGLPKRKTTFKQVGTTQVMARPDECTVTEIKQERGFVYLNLNGGDSWGYYHPENAPEFIHNFKGEPTYLTKELVPAYWDQLHNAPTAANTQGVLKLAFLDRISDTYYRGTYDTLTDVFELHPTDSIRKLIAWCRTNGVPLIDGDPPEWTMLFDPQDAVPVDIANQSINLFRPSPYMRAAAEAKPVASVPKTIKKVIFNMVGSDHEVYDRFINWLAYILQARDRATTSWVLHGTTGTGKGTFLHRIITPLFGSANIRHIRMRSLDEPYNEFVGRSLIVAVDEVEPDAFQNEAGVMADMRLYVTEPTVSIRRMHRAPREERNYSSWLLFSNRDTPVRIPPNDRRTNVGVYQDTKIILTDAELERIETELQAFHDYLILYPVDKSAAQTPLNNQARIDMIEQGMSTIDKVARGLNEGDMEMLIDALPTDDRYIGDAKHRDRVEDYKTVVKTLLDRTDRNNGRCNIARDELYSIFQYLVGGMHESPNKFTTHIRHHGIKTKKIRIGDKVPSGITTTWKDLKAWPSYLQRFAPLKPAAKPASRLALVK